MKILAVFLGLCCLSLAQAWLVAKKSTPPPAPVPTKGPVDSHCIELARSGSCTAYECMKTRLDCPIWLENALPSCQRMEGTRTRLTPEGVQWLDRTRTCLHEAMLEQYNNPTLHCPDLLEKMKVKSTRCAVDVTPNMCDIFDANTAVLMENRKSELAGPSSIVSGKCGWRMFWALLKNAT